MTVVHYGVERITLGRTAKPASPPVIPEVEAIRRECWARGKHMDELNDYADTGIADVFERTRCDIDLTVTAICMDPRPDWVEELLGC